MTCALLGWLQHPPARTALIEATTGASWSYAELAQAVRRAAAAISAEVASRRLLVACLCRADIDSVIGYLAALSGGHAVLLLDGDADAATLEPLLDRYRPDCVLRGSRCEPRAVIDAAPLHPELALLLGTSGSTGSPKTVRLSAANLDANAAQIVEYLAIDGSERALLSLPFHHAYGLSVLHSHLLAGATLVLPGASVVRPELWEAVRRYECTSFAGVPYAFTIIEKLGLDALRVPSLRTLTQAGGRMAPEQVLRFAARMRDRGGRLVVMYGQTEATARIAWLPPERVFEKPGAIGLPVPRGRLSLAPDGELVYEGPNVMLGYATGRADLGLGDVQGGVLPTGDLGAVDGEGFFSVVGRKRRIAKLCGQRVNLDELELLVDGSGGVVALELDERLVLVRGAGGLLPSPSELIRAVARRLQLPGAFIEVRDVDQVPRTAGGKPDYLRLAATLRHR